ncbi:MAG: cobyrinate a,c-diamide synthase [Nitrospirae bacterium]|nr:cobyrinate a,c-diamide synthase [Nitrospirota bacterium]
MSGIVVAGTHSGCGKTTITLGLMAAFRKKGLRVQPFKSGPDFIDTGLHGLVTGRRSRNLDLWMCGEDFVQNCFRRHLRDSDIAVVEGVMGLYDGSLSTAALAGCLGLPVVLVVDAYGMAETAGAIVKGIRDFRPPLSPLLGKEGMGKVELSLNFAGVVFNRVASENHYKRLKESITDMPVMGYLPRDLNFEIPHRHLGLTTAEDEPIARENLERLADTVIQHIDIDCIMKSGSSMRHQGSGIRDSKDQFSAPCDVPPTCRIAVARDRAFCFYYEDNLDLLREAGAELIFFSPLEDAQLPADIGGIYIGGGYPELHAEQLSQNRSMLGSVRDFAESDGAMYAECGGLMYLSKGIWKSETDRYEMSGVFPFETAMKKGRSRLGYRETALINECILGGSTTVARGHEFHYSEIMEGQDQGVARAYFVKNGSGDTLPAEGYSYKKTLASYIHLHFGSNPTIPKAFINSCKDKR